ncbi:MAG: pilin [bacterium]
MKKNLQKFVYIFCLIALFPVVTFAQTTGGLIGAIGKIQQILSAALPLLISIGVVYFVWGMVQYFIGDGEEAKKTGRDRILYGIIGLAVIVSIWGIVNLVVATFGVGDVNAPKLDTVVAKTACSILTNEAKLQDYLGYITCIINSTIIPLIFSLAVVMFVWGAVKFFIINSDEESKRGQGKQFMIWGIIALAVMISIWGLVSVLGATFGIKDTSILPQVCPGGSPCKK